MEQKHQYKSNNKITKKKYTFIPVRYIFAMLLAVAETLAVITILILLSRYVPYFYLAVWATEIGCVVNIIASDDNPDYKVPWLIFVLIVPIAGFMVYLMFYSRKLQPKYIKRLNQLQGLAYKKDNTVALNRLKAENPVAASQAKMLIEIADTHLFKYTKQTYYSLGDYMHESFLNDLKKAEKFIYMEYFIIEEGIFWNSILEVLKEKAARGIDVKVLYDDIGCMATLSGDYYKQLGKFGIKALPFSRLRGNADSEFNNRSHRKITVIDGKIGYTGGINLADEYINAIEKHGHWKDTALRLEGEAVCELTKLFLTDYGINAKQIPEMRTDLYPSAETDAFGYLIPFGDGPKPLYKHRVGKSVIQNILNSATDYVYMTSPYLIIDNDLCTSIENAALRGVDVKIVVPHIPDKKLVFIMTQSFYPRLMSAGVKIYEYTPGFIHAKSYVADDKYAMIGTINLDYRSLVHHFENGVWMYGTQSILDIKDDIENTLTKCMEITPDMLKTNLLTRIIRSVVRVLAPLL